MGLSELAAPPGWSTCGFNPCPTCHLTAGLSSQPGAGDSAQRLRVPNLQQSHAGLKKEGEEHSIPGHSGKDNAIPQVLFISRKAALPCTFC